jgi:NADP-dependent 3-hydroxy acid dehydrogenase YdfG
MTKTIIICGHGPGISDAVARRFGREGFQVALVARGAERLAQTVEALEAIGVHAAAFPADLGDPGMIRGVVDRVRQKMGGITVIHWNAYTTGADDLTQCDPRELHKPVDLCVTSLVAAVQAALPDLRAASEAAVLVTNGSLAFYDSQIDAMAVQWNVMGLAIAKAAQRKATGLLAEKLREDDIYVGEVVVLGAVKGTPFESGADSVEPSAIADSFWDLYQARDATSVTSAAVSLHTSVITEAFRQVSQARGETSAN